MILDKKKSEKLKLKLQQLLKNFQSGKYNETKILAKNLIKEFPENQFCWKVLGAALLHNGEILKAINANKKSIELNPQDPEAFYNLGISQKEIGRYEDAVLSYEKAVLLNPNYYHAYSNLGNINKKLGKFKEAENNYKKAINIKPDYADAYYNIGVLFQEVGKNDFAEENYKKAIFLKPNYPEAHNNLGSILQELGSLKEAEISFKKSIKLNPDLLESYINLCDLYEKLNRTKEGLILIKNTTKKFGENLSEILLYKAIFLFRQKKIKEFEQLIKKIKIEKLSLKRAPLFLNLKANWHNSQKDFEAAFKVFLEMNKKIKETSDFKKYQDRGLYKEVQSLVLQLKKLGLSKFEKKRINATWKQPIFLIGFPRSGTTLLDTILRTHSKINVIEEKPMLEKVRSFFSNTLDVSLVEKIDNKKAEKASKIYFNELKNYLDEESDNLLIDKLPLNILYLPLINQIFPKARYILAIRHPLDCVLSCWMQNFKLNEAMVNMCDLNQTSDFYSTSMEIFNLSKKRYNLNIHIIRYEDLVINFKQEITNLLSFLNLQWEDNLINYQKTALTRDIIFTPSYSQVLKPIYKSSTYRWKNYEENLILHKNKLENWINKFGY